MSCRTYSALHAASGTLGSLQHSTLVQTAKNSSAHRSQQLTDCSSYAASCQAKQTAATPPRGEEWDIYAVSDAVMQQQRHARVKARLTYVIVLAFWIG